MCLQIPGKIMAINGDKAVIDYDIEKREAFAADVDCVVGDWVLVVGQFIIEKVPEKEARASLVHWKRTLLD